MARTLHLRRTKAPIVLLAARLIGAPPRMPGQAPCRPPPGLPGAAYAGAVGAEPAGVQAASTAGWPGSPTRRGSWCCRPALHRRARRQARQAATC
jgi:hypothetical protein